MIDRILLAAGGMLWPTGDRAAPRRAYEQAAEAFFGAGAALAFWKGRIALYAILKALEIGEGDEVIVPGYTCVMVPGPVIYAGAKPVYVDIDPEHFNLRVDAVARQLSPRTRAILVQHTYGFPAPVREIKRLAEERGIPIIEDCCHTFGGRLDGQLLGTFGTAAFFSGQWNKPFSTGLGGLALVSDPGLAEKVRAQQAQFASPGFKPAFMLATQLVIYELLIYPRTTVLATQTFRWLSRRGLVVGSSSTAEFDRVMPENYPLRPTAVQCRLARREVARVADDHRTRLNTTLRYTRALPELGFQVPRMPADWQAPLVRFPLRVANKAEALAKAASCGVEIGSWFECPLHPAETDQRTFGYEDGLCPVAERAAQEVINLPTHRRVRAKDIDRTLAFVRAVCRPAKRQ